MRTPILKAGESYPEVRRLLDGQAHAPAAELLERSSAVDATRRLAAEYAEEAAEALEALPNSATRDALAVLCHKVVTGAPLK